ncbi:MAG TPA: OmpA family protein [Chitinophagaceae bacterium]|nr:OmpA family protein [Chitinophagaceae bacterium]
MISAYFRKLFLMLCCLAALTASAQVNINEKIRNKVNERIDRKTDEAIDKGLDAAESAGRKKEKDKKESTENKFPAKPAASDTSSPVASYSKFDFVPGEQVVFFDDFAETAVGDFPVNWNTNGTGEVVTLNKLPGKWLKWSAGVGYAPVLKAPFPDNFTLEFDILMTEIEEKEKAYFGLTIYADDKTEVEESPENIGEAGIFLSTQSEWEVTRWINGNGTRVGGTAQVSNSQLYGKKAHISIWGQKQRLRVYVNEAKVLDLPQGLPAAKLNRIKWTNNPGLNLSNDDVPPVYLSNVRIATGLPDTRSKLITEGRLVTRGILFDVNSDKIKAESYGTLKEIAQVLKENPGIKVKIIGHTDSDGNDASNLDLSKRRAAAVKLSLQNDFGVNVSGIITDGKGESEPASPNTSPEGKANNRRVEFIKL